MNKVVFRINSNLNGLGEISVSKYSNVKSGLFFKSVWFGERNVSNLVQGLQNEQQNFELPYVSGIRYQLTDEDVSVAVQRVHNEAHQLVNFSLKLVSSYFVA